MFFILNTVMLFLQNALFQPSYVCEKRICLKSFPLFFATLWAFNKFVQQENWMYKWTDASSTVCTRMIQFHILRNDRKQPVSFDSFMDEGTEVKRWSRETALGSYSSLVVETGLEASSQVSQPGTHSKVIFIQLQGRMNCFCGAAADPHHVTAKPGLAKGSNAKGEK